MTREAPATCATCHRCFSERHGHGTDTCRSPPGSRVLRATGAHLPPRDHCLLPDHTHRQSGTQPRYEHNTPTPHPAQHGSDAHYMHHNSTMHETRTHGSLSAPEPGRSRRHEALISLLACSSHGSASCVSHLASSRPHSLRPCHRSRAPASSEAQILRGSGAVRWRRRSCAVVWAARR